MATSLAETQKLLWRLITAPESAAAATGELATGLESSVVGDERLSAGERVDLYGGMYEFRIRDAIRENFSALASGLGDEGFRALVADYVRVHPSEHFSLREVGARLETFLRERSSVPWAADLAAFEWAFLGAFDAADAQALGGDALAGVPAEAWADLRFRFSPSLRTIDLAYAVAPGWEKATRGEPFEPPVAAPTSYRLWRREHQVYWRAIDATERAALAAAERETFGDVCAAVADRIGEDAAAAEAFAVLSRWIGDGIVVALDRG